MLHNELVVIETKSRNASEILEGILAGRWLDGFTLRIENEEDRRNLIAVFGEPLPLKVAEAMGTAINKRGINSNKRYRCGFDEKEQTWRFTLRAQQTSVAN